MQQERSMKYINPLEFLNEEIIFSILDCLNDDPEAKKAFSLVCKSFHCIESLHRKKLKPLCMELISRTIKRYPNVKDVDFTNCPRVEDAELIAVSDAYKGTLTSIDVSKSRLFTHVGLSSLAVKCSGLAELDLSNATELTDLAAAAIAVAKNLEKLSLARCKLISDMGIGCIAVGCKKLRVVCLKWCLRIGDLGINLIALKCKEIQVLDLSFLQITEKCLPYILKLQHLKELILMGCPGIDDEGLITLEQGCKSLEILDIANCQNISHVGLSSLTNGSDHLRQLSLSYGHRVTMDLAKSLQHFPYLRSIKLDGCQVTSSGMKSISECCTSLEELSLCKCAGVTDEGLSAIVQKQNGLQKLDITCCHKITFAAIDNLTKTCYAITSLRMESCSLVLGEAFQLIGERCHNLVELDVTDNKINDEGLKSIARSLKLSILKLGICLSITDSGLSYIGKSCSQLTELDLYRCMGITDIGIAAIASGCPALEMINMAYCDKVTNSSLISLSICSRLKTIEIRGCPRVCSVGLAAIARGCRQLTVIDIKKCHNIDDTGMLPLAQYSQNLKQINLSYCSVTDVGLLSLASICNLQNMTILHVSGLTPNGLVAAVLACRGLRKVKIHTCFKATLPEALLLHMEARGCIFHWRNKAFQAEVDPKGWQLHLER
ncbi:hypothetical protein Leryth_002733 [Lithospermum erythrorhizon]|nr:hypothetical protein Leryth_002733 [Lithospermum erythrorhizon]